MEWEHDRTRRMCVSFNTGATAVVRSSTDYLVDSLSQGLFTTSLLTPRRYRLGAGLMANIEGRGTIGGGKETHLVIRGKPNLSTQPLGAMI